MGDKPSTPKPPTEQALAQTGDGATVVKTHDANGFHFIEVNLDANQDGSGVSPWSVVGIIVGTLLVAYLLRRLLICCSSNVTWPFPVGPFRVERPAPLPAANGAMDYDFDPAPVRIQMERPQAPLAQNRGFGMYRSASELDLSRLASLRQGRLEAVQEEPRLATAAAGATQKRDPPVAKRLVLPNDIGPI